MFRLMAISALLMSAVPASATDPLPVAIDCYQTATNGKDIDAYMACFTDDAVMIDVNRTFEGQDDIRAWAEREVIKGGESFKHRKILETDEGYAKTEVNWLSWVVHYSYWWNADGKITKMSLQYAD
ncbi:MAG: nuclear transport factor 2 family protein [Pseudomonadota bacterium]